MATTPPGWYDDGRGALRWWDGQQWTEHVQTPDPEPAVAAAEVSDEPDVLPAADPAVTLDAPVAGEAEAEAGAPAPEAPPAPEVPTAPPGYPGGFPGGATPAGGFIAATEPKKSKLWILWVVLGVVLLGVVIAAAVLIPILIGLFGNAASGGASDADEAAAVAAVQLYDEAWGTVDCEKFTEATTEALRTELQLTTCDDFDAAATGFTESVEDYTVAVTSIERDDDEIFVTTSETFGSLYDDQGTLVDEPIPTEQRYGYTVVPADGGWAIDSIDPN